jgi:hypothetical protein
VKIYSLSAEMFMIFGKWDLAIKMYTKIACIIKTANMSGHSKMYAFK